MVSSSSQHIKNNFMSKSTEDLIKMWRTNDRDTWSDETFEIVHQILVERCKDIPDQRHEEPAKISTALFGNSELENYMINASGTTFFAINIIALIGIIVFGWLISVVYHSLAKGKIGWNYVVSLVILLAVGTRVNSVFTLIGIALYIIAWTHANIILFSYQKLAKKRLAEIEKQDELDTNTMMEKGLILYKVMRDKQSSIEILRAACGMQDGNPLLLTASGQTLIRNKQYQEALYLLNRVPKNNIDKPLLLKVNKCLKIINNKMK